jgi:lactate permease
MGKMIDAQSIVVAGVATGQQGQEGNILRYVFFHSLALAVLVGCSSSSRPTSSLESFPPTPNDLFGESGGSLQPPLLTPRPGVQAQVLGSGV